MRSIAIVIPVYNRASMLMNTLESVLGQTYRPIELILVDNGSTDASLDVCLEFQRKYSSESFSVKVLQELKKGANAARNTGLSAVTSEYVTFFDSDDEMFPCMLDSIAKAIEEHNPDIVAYYSIYTDEKGKRSYGNRNFTTSVHLQILHGLICTAGFTVRASIINAVGGWNENLFRWQDWELIIRLLLHTQNIFSIKDKPLNNIYIHSNSITGTSFSSSANFLHDSVTAALNVVRNSSSLQKDKLIRTVYYRFLLLAGLYTREGNKELGSSSYRNLMAEITGYPRLRLLFPLLYRYIAWGGGEAG